MSTEWIQIVVVLAVFVPLTLLTGRYLVWRRWDRERRQARLAERRTDAWVRYIYDQDNPGFSVKV